MNRSIETIRRSLSIFEQSLEHLIDSRPSFWAKYRTESGELVAILTDDEVREQIQFIRWKSFFPDDCTLIRYDIKKQLGIAGQEWIHPRNTFIPFRDNYDYLDNVDAFEYLLNYLIRSEYVEKISNEPKEKLYRLGDFFSYKSIAQIDRRPKSESNIRLISTPLEIFVKRILS